MNRTAIGGAIFVLLILAISLAGAFYLGIGPAPGGPSGEPITDFPTATPANGGSPDGGSSDGSSSGDAAPFSFTVDNVEECGPTCRDVTATLHNDQDEPATGVTVYIRIFAGQNNTDIDDRVWEGRVDVGSLDPGGVSTTTERVELSIQDARKVDQADGWITILTTVQSDETTVTFRESEQVG